MPNRIKKFAANLLLGDEVKRLNEATQLMANAYLRGPFELPPEVLISQLKEYDSTLLWDLVMQLGYDQIGGAYTGYLNDSAERTRAIKESQRLWKYDVLAQWIIWTWTNFGFGENLEVIPMDERAQDIWDDFWYADENQIILSDDEIQALSEDGNVNGEIFFVYYISQLNGKVQVSVIDPLEISEIIVDKTNPYKKLLYKRQYENAAGQMQTLYYIDIAALNDPVKADEFIEDASLTGGDTIQGIQDKLAHKVKEGNTFVCVQHVPFNRKSRKMLRGWPLLTAGASWIRESNKFEEHRATLAAAVAMIVNKIKVDAGSRGVKDIRSAIASTLSANNSIEGNPPSVGGTMVHNKAMDVERMPLTTGGSDSKFDRDGIGRMAALGGGLLAPYVGLGDYSRLATACYSEDTELLTEYGWMKWTDWSTGIKIATYNHEFKRLDYMHPTKLHIYNYCGKMISIKGKGIDALVTPNHRMLVLNENNAGREWGKKEFEVIEAEYLPSRFAIPVTAKVDRPDIDIFVLPGHSWDTGIGTRIIENKEIKMDDWLQFLGLWISVGSLYKPQKRPNYSIEITQSINSTENDKIRDLLKRLSFSFSESKGHFETTRWRCNNKSLYTWLLENCGKGSANKRLPSMAFSLSVRQSQILLNSLWDGDGHAEYYEHFRGFYSTTSEKLADDIQALIINSGEWGCKSLARGEHDHKLFVKIAPEWVVFRNEYKKRSLTKKKNISEVDYCGKVWCFEAPPNKMFITRRNGRPIIAGNTSMETPMLRSFSRYQRFWAAQFRKMVWVVLRSDELWGNQHEYETYEADVSTDRLVEVDLTATSEAISRMLKDGLQPYIDNYVIAPEAANPILAAIWQIALQALNVENAAELTDEDHFVMAEPEDKTVDNNPDKKADNMDDTEPVEGCGGRGSSYSRKRKGKRKTGKTSGHMRETIDPETNKFIPAITSFPQEKPEEDVIDASDVETAIANWNANKPPEYQGMLQAQEITKRETP